MSLTVLRCDYCGESSIPLDGMSANIELQRSINRCDHCHSRTTIKLQFFFHSHECMLKYLAEKREDYDAQVVEFQQRKW